MLIAMFVMLPICMAGCGGGGGAPAGAGFRPIDPSQAVFWDRQTTESAELLRQIIAEFDADRGGALPVKVERAGGYTDIFRKVSASIQARKLPAMAVAYENMVAEYIPTGAVTALDDFIHDPKDGFSAEEIDDFFPAVLQTNTYAEAGGKMYSFPFAKSVLMLYSNKRVLAAAGIAAPPQTWDEFLAQCRAVREKTGKFAYALNADCSSIDAMIFSFGGDVVRGRETLFDSPQALQVFELLETLAKERLAYQITPNSFDDEMALGNDQVAFTMRTSSGRANMALLMGDTARWALTRIPQADPQHPATVLYGSNIAIFNTTPEQQSAAWAFVKYFTSRPVSVRWALGTGYIPIRRSAAQDPAMQKFWGQWEGNRAAYDCLAFSRPEPNLSGWQQVRDAVVKAESEVLSGAKTGKQAAQDLKRAADEILGK
jgi:multiple sugar transport system substrate-binding protein